jgi:hypothetical protein
MDLISWIGMARSIQRCGRMRSECKLGFETSRMPAIETGSQAWEGCGCQKYMRLARFIRFPPHGQAAF